MAKQIKITHDGREYILEYTRRAIEAMEREGFNLQEISTKPMTRVFQLFQGAFIARHPKVTLMTVEDIYKHLGNREKLLTALVNMYQEPLNELFDESNEGNATWEEV